MSENDQNEKPEYLTTWLTGSERAQLVVALQSDDEEAHEQLQRIAHERRTVTQAVAEAAAEAAVAIERADQAETRVAELETALQVAFNHCADWSNDDIRDHCWNALKGHHGDR